MKLGYLRSILPLFVLFLITSGIANAQVEKIQAAYIYNFATMSNYPPSYQNGNFIIAIMGNHPISSELEAIAKSKKIGNQTIEIRKINSVAEIENVHMVFVSDAQKSKMPDVITKTQSKATVVVGETAGSCVKGAIFNLVLVEQKLRFEVNEDKANAKGVKLAANLVKLGITVKS